MAVSGSPGMAPRSLRSLGSSPDVIIYPDTEGSGKCAGLIFGVHSKSQGACLLTYKIPQEEKVQATGADLIFALCGL